MHSKCFAVCQSIIDSNSTPTGDRQFPCYGKTPFQVSVLSLTFSTTGLVLKISIAQPYEEHSRNMRD